MRLLLLFPSRIRGGAEEYVLKIARGAIKSAYDVYAAFPKTEKTETLIAEFEKLGVQYYDFPVDDFDPSKRKNVLRLILWFFKNRELIHEVSPDVVLVNAILPDACLGAILASISLRVPVLTVFQLVPPEFRASPLRTFLVKFAVRSPYSSWIAVSDNNRKILSKVFNIPKNRIDVIYNGVNPSYIPNLNSSDCRQKICQEFKLKHDSVLVLTVAKLNLRKGYDLVASIIPKISKEYPNVRFIWVGGGSKDWLVSMIRQHEVEDKVILTGYRNDVQNFLNASDLFLFPTRYEGHSFALSEAMSFGLPIISSNASGIPEIIQHHIHGVLFENGDSLDLCQKLKWALDNPGKMIDMGLKAKLHLDNFSEEIMIAQTLSKVSFLLNKNLHSAG